MKCKLCGSEHLLSAELKDPFGKIKLFDSKSCNYHNLKIYALTVCTDCGHIDFQNNFSPRPDPIHQGENVMEFHYI